MPIQLTPEQEQRLHSFVDAGTYSTPEEVLDAALSAFESSHENVFEGSAEELNQLLMEGLNSGDPIEVDDAFWQELKIKTDKMIDEHGARKSRS
jgi:Arc/MetJ-type ribon-helix-helix transcriptional regulator